MATVTRSLKRYVQERDTLKESFLNEVVFAESLKELSADAQSCKVNLMDKFKRIENLDNLIKDFWDEDDDAGFSAELTQQEDLRERFNAIMLKLKFEASGADVVNKVESAHSLASSKQQLLLPKIELIKFDGNLRNWLNFWSQFERIHNDNNLRNVDKYLYLLAATEGTPKNIVEKFPATDEGYTEAIKHLKSRFGQTEELREVYIRELLFICQSKNEKVGVIYDKIEGHLRSLHALGLSRDNFSEVLFPLIESCIPQDTLIAWERCKLSYFQDYRKSTLFSHVKKEPGEIGRNFQLRDKLNALMDFLRNEADSEGRIKRAQDFKSFEEKVEAGVIVKQPTGIDLVNKTQQSAKACLFCERSSHLAHECNYAFTLSYDKRCDIISTKKACRVCFRLGHFARDCKFFVKCMFCAKRHYLALCKDFQPKVSEGKVPKEDDAVESNLFTSNRSEVYLQTLCVKIKGPNGTKTCRIILDSGSQHSYIKQSLVEELGLQPQSSLELVHCLFGAETKIKTHKVYSTTLSGVHNNGEIAVEVLDEPDICGNVPKFADNLAIQEMRQRGIFVDDTIRTPNEISMLIGADYLAKIYTGKLVNLKSGPCAIETILGWSVMGQSKNIGHKTGKATITSLCLENMSIPKALWEVESLGILDPVQAKSTEEVAAAVQQHFNDNLSQLPDGRYEVVIPWNSNVDELTTNYGQAYKRLESVTRRLKKERNFLKYNQVFLEWESLGIIEEVPLNPSNGHFLSHHAVIRNDKTSTKIRPVFDASLKGVNQLALNDCLEAGPNLVELIPHVLTKFRKGEVGIVSDLEKAFLQISISEKDRNYFKFLWWNKEGRLKCWRHKRVVFGVVTSPFFLNAVLKHHISTAPPKYCEVADKLNSGFYCDDLVISLEKGMDIPKFIKDASDFLDLCQFKFKNWVISDAAANPSQADHMVLGMVWNYASDTLSVVADFQAVDPPITKRKLLSSVNKVFDPLGIVSAAAVIPKILLRECWKLNLGWDTPVPEDVEKKFFKWLEESKYLTECKIPRHIGSAGYTIHVFNDASQDAYGSCIFVRSSEGLVHLILAKSRLAPIKPKMSIPRLELMAAVIGVRLYSKIKNILNDSRQKVFWTDSTSVISWINGSNLSDVFVRNRVKEILTCVSPKEWRHVPGEENVSADLLSRGCTPSKLWLSRWWEGPKWLNREDPWYTSVSPLVDNVCFNAEEESTEIVDRIVGKFSSYLRIVRVLAYVFRALARFKGEQLVGELTDEELLRSELYLFKYVQGKSCVIQDKSLCNVVVLDMDDGIFRIQSKLVLNPKYHEHFTKPIILPDKCDFTQKLVYHFHKRLSHAGVLITLSKIRERFWIVRGRRLVKKIINQCIICARYRAKPAIAPRAPLPCDRTELTHCFSVTGVDACGPLLLNDSQKCWVIVFTCATYRAVHFELVSSMSTDHFLLSLRRFIARRGRVTTMYSDNGTNFVGSANLLKDVDWEEILRETSCTEIKWKLIPPSSPWWGGWWERMIRILKDLLRKQLGLASVNFEELYTIICDIESFINSRPLTYVSEDGDELVALTPAHFLTDIQTSMVPDLDFLDAVSFSRRLRYIHSLRDELKNRFKSEYLSELVRYRRPAEQQTELGPGQVVLISSDNTKRLLWPLGRIVEVFKGRDGHSRVARVKTAKGELTRPVQRLYPLEIPVPLAIPAPLPANEPETEDSSLDIAAPCSPLPTCTRRGRIVKAPMKLNL